MKSDDRRERILDLPSIKHTTFSHFLWQCMNVHLEHVRSQKPMAFDIEQSSKSKSKSRQPSMIVAFCGWNCWKYSRARIRCRRQRCSRFCWMFLGGLLLLWFERVVTHAGSGTVAQSLF